MSKITRKSTNKAGKAKGGGGGEEGNFTSEANFSVLTFSDSEKNVSVNEKYYKKRPKT